MTRIIVVNSENYGSEEKFFEAVMRAKEKYGLENVFYSEEMGVTDIEFVIEAPGSAAAFQAFQHRITRILEDPEAYKQWIRVTNLYLNLEFVRDTQQPKSTVRFKTVAKKSTKPHHVKEGTL